MARPSRGKKKAIRKARSIAKRKGMGKGNGAGGPQFVEAKQDYTRFRLDMGPEDLDGSRDRLVLDILAMFKNDVEAEIRKQSKKDRKPDTVHGKQYTPRDGAFLVDLVHPGKSTVTLLVGKKDLYVNGMHTKDIWFLLEGCDVAIPPRRQVPHISKTVVSRTAKGGSFTFKEGIFNLNWSGSYLDLDGGLKQPFFHGAPQKAHDMLANAENLVAQGKDCFLQAAFAFFIIFIPESVRFPEVYRWTLSHTAPGMIKPEYPPSEHRVMMRSWGTRSDAIYSPEAPIEIKRSVGIIKRNPWLHSLLGAKDKKGSSSSVPCKNASASNGNQPEAIIQKDSGDEDKVNVPAYSFVRHKEEVLSVACHPSDTLLVLSGGVDEKAYLWTAVYDGQDGHENGQELARHTDTIRSVSFSADGSFMSLASMDGTVSIWTTVNSTLFTTLEGPGGEYGFEWVKWHPKGPALMAGSDDSNLWLWHMEQVKRTPIYFLALFAGHTSKVTCGDFIPDGKLLCSGSDDGSLIVWKLQKPSADTPHAGQIKWRVQGENFHSTGLTCLAVSKDQQLIFSCAKDGAVRVVSVASGQVIGALDGHDMGITSIGISASGVVATGSRDCSLIIWDVETGTPEFDCTHTDIVTSVAWLGNSKFLATGCGDGSVSIWDSASGECHAILKKRHADRVLALAVSHDVQFIISAGADAIAISFDIAWLLEGPGAMAPIADGAPGTSSQGAGSAAMDDDTTPEGLEPVNQPGAMAPIDDGAPGTSSQGAGSPTMDDDSID